MRKQRQKGRRVRRNTDFDVVSPFEDKEPVEIGAPTLTEAEVPAEK
jgi:hypothetical protein